MTNVTSLHGHPVAVEVNEEVIETLERLLQEARDGQILGLAYAAAQHGDKSSCGWTNCPDGVSLGTGILGLSYRFGQATWE